MSSNLYEDDRLSDDELGEDSDLPDTDEASGGDSPSDDSGWSDADEALDVNDPPEAKAVSDAAASDTASDEEARDGDPGGDPGGDPEPPPPAKKPPKSGFFPTFNKGTKEVRQSSAGAGFIGLIGFGAMLLVASVFFVTENYFISMFTISIGLFIYVAGTDLIILALSTFIIFFSSKHLNNRATSMQETVVALKNILNIKRGRDGSVAVGPVDNNVSIELPDNPLSRDIQELVASQKNFEYAEYVAHSYYQDCHELYESSNSNFDFVSATMPLFGLIGTIIGLIAMFDSLGSDVTVESLSPQLALALKTTLYGAIFSSFYKIIGTRFERRMVDLDYDYDAFCRALQVIVENRNRVEIRR